ncbi:adenylate/guanylate cyclase domain-containing protein [Nocardioides sp. GCM10027113]|uniref:adenylate/guanylate cyclase domain-containing protein n=1 Tax=unclassified Nocardioides TaxID=2615069 RepID=UPI00360DB702
MAEGRPLAPPEEVEAALLGEPRTFTRVQVAERAGVPLEVAEELWQQLGFPHTADDDVAFTEADVRALRQTSDLISLGILEPDSQSALVRTWGRSFARLAEWQVGLLTGLAVEGPDPEERLTTLMDAVIPGIEELQAYVWRRHLASAASRLLTTASVTQGSPTTTAAVAFVDIVGYTGRSKNLGHAELVDLVEHFEDQVTRTVVEHGGRVIKTIGDEVLFVTDDPRAAAEVALAVTERGADDEDPFPQVRAGIAYGDVVSRLGDVFGPTVNIAARLTSVARPGTVLVDRGAYEFLSGPAAEDDTRTVEIPVQRAATDEPVLAGQPVQVLGRLVDRAAEELAELSPYSEAGGYRFRRMTRRPVKGYSRLEPFVLRRAGR